ncbi:abnormal spindle-like microcephaly-associated protein [Dunckerocampus dactyliophorus]|uniref:abnormal spindle-like microcephaly-associated protein n=1 Tax=Dunckerocampus dactyliophorus TaxID=161453 RepID=UPI002407733E|nr:abnormal spindle-like microcephaly-associated protein [Dunckerocampus dactyliophorus]
MATLLQGTLMDFSPIRNGDPEKENDVPVLSLVLFSKAPFVSFGTTKVGTSKSAVLRIENPTEDAEVEVTVDKIPSSKGFTVNQNAFTIQPLSSFSMTITWTPNEEGGIRELIIFNANNVLKHQAVLLGRAEASQKKKKSLWDTIKKKRAVGKASPYRGKRMEPPTKMAANKIVQVSQKQQHKRDKLRSPLSSLNEGKPVKEKFKHQHRRLEDHHQKSEQSLNPTQKQWSLADQENVRHVQRHSSHALATKTTDMCQNKALSKILNTTLSPIGTPEKLKEIMPHIQSVASPVSRGPALSMTDALALIGSDLSSNNSSPQDTSSSYGFSDSLESKSDEHECGPNKNVFNAQPDSPELSESTEPRLTFSKKVVPETEKAVEIPKGRAFNCETVIKKKAPMSERKIKKSRRCLLEKTLEMAESSSQAESGPSTPQLPVIEPDTRTEGSEEAGLRCVNTRAVQELNAASPTQRLDGSPSSIPIPTSSPKHTAHRGFTITSPPLKVPNMTSTITSPSPLGQFSPIHCSNKPNNHLPESSPAAVPPELISANHLDSFPIHLAKKSRKRKSEEYLKSVLKIDDGGKTEPVKRTRTVAWKNEPTKSTHERSTSQRQRAKSTGSGYSMKTPSLKTTKSSAPSPTKPTSTKLPSQGATSLKSSRAQSVRCVKPARVAAVAQSMLTFIKPAQTAIPRHPLPFAAKNMFYDERWIEKQERGFTWWLNYVLTPDDFKVNTEITKVSAASLAMGCSDKFSVAKAPTKEEMSFSTYTARRKLNRLRRSACQLFTSESMAKAIKRLEIEVEAKRLLIRKDRHLWKDIGERQKVLNWLLAYNPLWLRIGLETIFGELISLESNSDTMGMAMFILQRLLWNPDIAAEFRHPKVPHLYKDGHEEALSRFTLKKLLLLVCFLDKAKESRLIEHDPCLFCMDAEFKTSKDLLLAFSRDFLSGEGILPRHLGYLGLPVSHVQAPLDEFNFAVRNLAVDLKCGVRLVRVMELLIKQWGLSAKLRLPAISRLQKVHNVDISLQVLKSQGVDLKDEHGHMIESRDIVDGHRERTLSLLWKIIFSYQVEVILDVDQLREEIGFLRRTLRIKRRLASLRADRGLDCAPKTKMPCEHGSTKVALLMEWTRAVCDFYNLKVENFTVTFSDGRVLCYLIHHYHPSLVSEDCVHNNTTQTVECSPRGRMELDCSAVDSDDSFDYSLAGRNGLQSPSVAFKELLENEKSNFRLVNTAVAFLGGVPAMINPADMSNTIPNEKVVMSYLSFLCARLLDLRNETRAARVIQGAWRKYRLKRDLQLYKERNMAALKIQVVVRHFLQRRRAKKQCAASIIIQSVWRGYVTRKTLRTKKETELRNIQHQAATVIQAQWRMFSTMRYYQKLRYYTVVVQAQWRMKKAISAFGRIYWATTVIKRYLRASILARKMRERYLLHKSAVIKIQRGYRRWKILKTRRETYAAKVIQTTFKKWYTEKMAKRVSAAVKIQSWYRMKRCLFQYRKFQSSILLIQAHYRGHVQRQHFQRHKHRHDSAIVIQSAFRGYTVRKHVMKMKYASVLIQRWYRASMQRNTQRQMFVKLCWAARTIQAAYREKRTQNLMKKQHKAATLIQATFRKFAAQRNYHALRKAAVVLQQKYRATVLARKTKEEYGIIKIAVITIQATWRGRADRKRIEKYHQCATLIRAYYCRHKAQVEYKSKKVAAVVIQRHYRNNVAAKETRKAFLQKRAACVILQAGFRGMKVRTDLKEKHKAATVIQSAVRMFLARKRYILLQSAAIIIQSHYRALLEGREQQHVYRKQKKAALKIQAVYRAWRAREEIKKRHNAARVIQAKFRMYRARMAYLATKCAAVIIQERFRAKILMNQQLKKYRVMKSAAVVIQASYRGHRTRMDIVEMHSAAVVIQRQFLTFHERNKFVSIRRAAMVFQQRYRALTLMREVQTDYLSKRRAATCLQAAFRGYKVRKQLIIKHKAALTIQSNFRKYQQNHFYRRLQWAASVVQERYRANKKMRNERWALRTKRNAAIVLQAAFRGLKSRQIIKQKHQAATTIQRAFRAYSEHKKYLALKSSVLAVQRRYRATIAAKAQMQHYRNMHKAALVIQASYKRWRVRKDIALWHQAATVIQSIFRQHREEVKFQAMRLSAVFIQRYYRAHVLQKRERAYFLKIRSSAIVLQAAFRGHSVRRGIAKMHRSATVLQANFKRHKQQATFRKQRWAACILQQRFRALRQRNCEVKKYDEVRKAVICLQAAFRGMKSRHSVRQMHLAATTIQRAFRAHCEHNKYISLKTSVLTIQRRYRATIAAKAQLQHYQNMQTAVVIIQAAYRGTQVRKCVARWHQAATLIQSVFRRHKEEVKFQAMRVSAIIIQRYYRAYVLQKQDSRYYYKIRSSAIVLQAAFRGHSVRRGIAKMHRAATVLQANFKRHKQQTTFRRQRWAACVLQQRFRALRQRNIEVQHYQEVKKAVMTLQAAFRGKKSRQSIRQMRLAATTIQTAFRAHCEHKKYLALKASVVIIQRRYRATVAAKKQMQHYQNTQKAALVIQASYKRWRVRKDIALWHQAATVIQSIFRQHREEVKFQAMRLSAVFIQRYYRAHVLQKQERAYFLKIRSSAIVVQAAFRGHSARKRIAKMQRAATVLQANFKRHKQQKTFRKQQWAACVLQQRFRARRQRNIEVQHYQEVKKAVMTLQAAFRGTKSRQSIRQMHLAATTIQTAFRGHRELDKYLKIKSSVLTIQRQFRTAVAAKAQRKRFLDARCAAIVLQAAYRGQQARKWLAHLHRAATVIQSAYRKHVEVVKFQAMRASAVVIQRCYRAFILQRQERNKFLKILQSTIIIQAAYKGYCVRKHISRQSQAATLIQSHWRCLIQRRIFRKKREAALKLQQKVRAVQVGKVDRNKFVRLRQAAITLQTQYRAWTARKRKREVANAQRRLRFTGAVYHHLSAIKIQRALRARWALESATRQIHSVLAVQRLVRVRQQRKRFLEDRRKVVTAQRAVRRWLARRHSAASVIQEATRRFLLLRRQKRIEHGIVKAQALWRGHCSRRLNDNVKVIKLRHKLRKVSASAREEDKLSNKTSSALDCILQYKRFSYILEALKNLEATTRLSPVCCEQLVDSGATSVIFKLIRCCNRSVSCMDVITYSIQILLNLSKYHKTIEAVYLVENSVDTLVGLLQQYREKAGDKVAGKGGSIFTKACFLLALLLQDKHHAEEVTKLPKVLDRLTSIYRLTVRKNKMDAERSVMKQKINGSFYIQQTPRKSRPVPKFAPDWVLRKDKLKDIVDPLMAIQMVANMLSIVL